MLRILDRMAGGLLALLGLLLIAMVGLSVWNVVARYVFGSALLWADEVATFAMVVLAYLGAVACAWRGAEIRMDLLTGMLPAGIQRAILVLQQVVIAGMCFWVTWLCWGYVARMLAVGMRATGSGVPLWIINAVLPLSFVCFALIALLRLARLLAQGSASLSVAPAGAEVPPE